MSTPVSTTSSAAPPGAVPSAPAADLVRFTAVTKTYSNGFTALAPIEPAVEAGRIVSIVGPSGCGTTKLLRIAGGLSSPTTGELTAASEQSSFVFQDPTPMAWRNVLAHAELVSRILKLPRAERRRRAVEPASSTTSPAELAHARACRLCRCTAE
jgi:NitT/TauT family transport system ATP-binding protein